MGKSSKIVEARCRSCSGTGLYSGFAEPKGVAVLCLTCDGTGCEKIHYIPFEGRALRSGIKTVRMSAGSSLVTGVGPYGGEVTYSEFLNGRRPSRVPAKKPAAQRKAKTARC